APAWLRDPPAGIPADLLHLLERMLAKSPDQRLESAADVAEALAQHATPAVSNFVVPAGLQSSSQSPKRPISLAAVCCAWAIVALLCMLIPDGDQAASVPSHLSTEAGTVKTVHVAAAEGPQET